MIIHTNKSFGNKRYLTKIEEGYNYALDLLKVQCKDLEININFVSCKEIQRLNKDFRNIDKITDVLSFPNLLECGKENMQLIQSHLTKENFQHEINHENGHVFLGDICICKNVVYAHAREYGNSKEREMVYIAVHGLLHLLGYDHILDDDKKIMREVEEKIMSKINLGRE